MSTTSAIRRTEALDWVVVANAARARFFERDPDNGAMRELAGMVHPQTRMKGQELGHDRPGKAHKGEASTAFPPHTDPRRKEHAEFAREVAQRLEEAALEHHFAHVSVLASNPFLGELKAQLGGATQRQLQAAVPLDLTPLAGAELEQRIGAALQAAEPSPPETAG